MDFIKEGAQSILGKRVSQGLLHDTKKRMRVMQGNVVNMVMIPI